MSNNRYITETVDKEHIHFGGIIYSSDYVTDYLTQMKLYLKRSDTLKNSTLQRNSF
jgi:hypothetical protein